MRLELFLAHCDKVGLKLLKDDVSFIQKRLNGIPFNIRRDTLKQYCDKWVKAMAECKDNVKRQNTGRHAANSFIREFNQ